MTFKKQVGKIPIIAISFYIETATRSDCLPDTPSPGMEPATQVCVLIGD